MGDNKKAPTFGIGARGGFRKGFAFPASDLTREGHSATQGSAGLLASGIKPTRRAFPAGGQWLFVAREERRCDFRSPSQ